MDWLRKFLTSPQLLDTWWIDQASYLASGVFIPRQLLDTWSVDVAFSRHLLERCLNTTSTPHLSRFTNGLYILPMRSAAHFYQSLSQYLWLFDKCNFYMIFIILLFIKIVSFPLFLLIWFNFYLYLSIHLCFEGMRRFQINLQGLYMQSGAKPIESNQLTSSQAWIQEKTNPIKFKSNWSKESKEICTKSKSNSD